MWVQQPRIMSTLANGDVGYISEVSFGRTLDSAMFTDHVSYIYSRTQNTTKGIFPS